MRDSQTGSSVRVEVIEAGPEQQPIVANLMELYVYDFSEMMAFKVGEDGRFSYPDLSLYWTEDGRHPFLIRVDDHWGGFVLVRRGSRTSGDENVWDMAEFFVMRSYRRLGVGTKVAHEIWRRFPGRWEVRVIVRNEKALSFWRGAVGEFVGTPVEPSRFDKGEKVWHVFSFESAAP
jgi:predicted acetyltransferase